MASRTDEEMSFEEFSALRRRNRSMQQTINPAKDKGQEISKNSTLNMKPYLGRVSEQLESQEIQFLMILIISLDVLAVLVQLLLQSHTLEFSADTTTAIQNAIKYQAGFCNTAYLIEFVALIVVFRLNLFSHFGYLTDIVCFGFIVTSALQGGSQMIRLLGLLRFWRMVRFVNSIIQGAESEHEQTRQLLVEARESLSIEQQKTKQAKLELKRETQKRHQMSDTFRTQREEIETLREALSIAAQAVAETQGYSASTSQNQKAFAHSTRTSSKSISTEETKIFNEGSEWDDGSSFDDDEEVFFHDTKELARLDEENEIVDKTPVSVA